MAEIELHAKALNIELWKAGQAVALQRQGLNGLIEALRTTNNQLKALGGKPNATKDRQIAFEAQREIAQLIADFAIASTQNTTNTLAAVEAVQKRVARPSSDLLAQLSQLNRALPPR